MLRHPYTSYQHLYVYHLDLAPIPQIQDPDLIGAWIEDDNTVLFFHRPKENLVQQICRDNNCQLAYEADLSYKDWEAGHDITSFDAAGMTISPVWETGPADIRLDPSVIFGSGFHPTTRTCLELIMKYLGSPEMKIDSMLDLGTGTGLLSICAGRNQVGRIMAIDNNPLACQVAQANCHRNQVDEQVSIKQLDLRKELPNTANYDLVVANLYRGLLQELIETPSFWQAKYYIISGFIQPMEAELLASLPAHHIRFLDRKRIDKWCIWGLMTT